MGFEGSVLVTLTCYFSMAAISYYYGQKHYPIPYHTLRNLLYIAGTVALTYAVMAINIENQVWATTFHMLMVLVFMFLIFLLERKNIKPAKS